MYKTLSVITGASLSLSVLFYAAPVAALSCMMSYPTMGTVQSITQQGGSEWSTINLDHVGVYDASSLSGGAVNIDSYNSLAKKFIENGYQVPSSLKRTLSEWETQENVLSTSKSVTVTTSGLSAMKYAVGDVVVAGPPGGATCNQYGFIGIFGTDGKIKSAFAYNNGFVDYTYGNESLVVDPGVDYECVTDQYGGANCKREVNYALNGVAASLRVSQTRDLGGSYFSDVTLVRSTINRPASDGTMMMIAGGSPIRMEQVMNFNVSTQSPGNTLSASPTSGASPLVVNFAAKVSKSGLYGIDFGDGSKFTISLSEGLCTDGVDFGACGLKLDGARHTYSTPGTYTATLYQNGLPLCANCQPPVLGTATINVSGSQTSSTFSAVPTSGYAPLAVDFYAPTDSFDYRIDFGDGSALSQYWGPNTQTICRVRTGGPSSCVAASHTYQSAGNFTARLMKGGQTVGSASVAVASNNVVPPPNPPPGSCPVIMRTLSRGSRGADVMQLQQYFISIGVLGANSASGYFGPLTEGAVQEWQASHGLVSAGSPSTTGWGVVGRRTRAALTNCDQ